MNHFESLIYKKKEIIYPILYFFHSKLTSIFSNNYFSIHSNPLSIILNFFLSLFNINSRLSFPILTFLSLTILHQSFLIFFYLLVNHNTHLSLSVSPFLSHSILHLLTSIFFYLFVNLTSRLSFSIFHSLSHPMLYLST